jgi:hypothetical protein
MVDLTSVNGDDAPVVSSHVAPDLGASDLLDNSNVGAVNATNNSRAQRQQQRDFAREVDEQRRLIRDLTLKLDSLTVLIESNISMAVHISIVFYF